MASAQLPPLTHEEGALRIILVPEVEVENAADAAPDHEPESYETLSSARYSGHDSASHYSASRYSRPDSASRYSGRDSASYTDSESDDGHEDDMHEAETPPLQPKIPTHPIPDLQEAFTESLHEVMGGTAVKKPKLRELDATARREALLGQVKDDVPFDAAWRFRPGQTQHELAKLVAQISFGVYLLLDGMANSNTQVVSILQSHIDEVDEFLEVTLEDLAQTENDLKVRVDNLKLPMANMKVFVQLLEDRKYRAEILEGNERVDHVLARTNVAVEQWDADIDAGLQSTNVFIRWLNEHGEGNWRKENPDVVDIFDAMNGNAEGWLIAFDKIGDHIQDINNHMVQLLNLISEMEKTIGEVSRKNWTNIAPFSSPANTDANSPSSTARSSSHRSAPKPNAQASSTRSGASAFRPASSMDNEDETGTIQFPMPSGAPLISPLRTSLASPGPADGSVNSNPSHQVGDVAPDDHDEAAEPPLLLLQPRTYTPQPPAPLPSPRVKDESTEMLRSRSTSAKPRSPAWEQSEATRRSTSLRQRVALKTSPPEAIHIPPSSIPGMQVIARSASSATPRTTPSHQHDSAYGSDPESSSRQQAPAVGSQQRDLSPPVYPNVMPSPRSDHQRYYHPVLASPHSPLQQRPHTAVAYPQSGPTLAPPSHLANMGMLSVTQEGSDDHSASRSTRTSRSGDKQLKKKKSAFGWLKKAFSMDEEERAAYEARRAMQYQDTYYRGGNQQRFLDGKRLR